MDEGNDIEVTLDDLRDADIDELAEQHDLDPEVVDDQLEARLADKAYREAQPEPKPYTARIRDGIKGVQQTVFPMADIPTTATIENVGTKGDIITLDIAADNRSIERTIRLDSGGQRINDVLQHVGVSKPSELRNKPIPIRPVNGSFDSIQEDVPSSRFRPLYTWRRFLLRVGAYAEGRRSIRETRTWLLLNGLVFFSLLQGINVLLPTAIKTLPFLLFESGGSLSVGGTLFVLSVVPLLLYGVVVAASLGLTILRHAS